MGSLHAASIVGSPDAYLAGVLDTSPFALDRARAHHSVPTTADLDEFLRLPMDGVVIASSTPFHAEQIKAAADAGLAVFSEKPVGLSCDECDDALGAVVAAGVIFQIGFQRRWDPRYRRMKEMIDAGDIGDVVLYKAFGRDSGPSDRAGWGRDKNGGLFVNSAIHDLDAARWLTGLEVTSVQATGAALVHSDLDGVGDVDVCMTTLWLGGRAMGCLEWNRFSTTGHEVGVEIIGTQGTLQLGRPRRSPIVVRRTTARTGTLVAAFGPAYRASMLGFIAAIANGETTSPGIEEARCAMQLALLARESFDQAGAVIPVPRPDPIDPARHEPLWR